MIQPAVLCFLAALVLACIATPLVIRAKRYRRTENDAWQFLLTVFAELGIDPDSETAKPIALALYTEVRWLLYAYRHRSERAMVRRTKRVIRLMLKNRAVVSALGTDETRARLSRLEDIWQSYHDEQQRLPKAAFRAFGELFSVCS